MKRYITALLAGFFLLFACKGKSGRVPSDHVAADPVAADHAAAAPDTGLRFSIDTTRFRQVDSNVVNQRRSDSELLSKAGSAPGINAGIGNFDIQAPAGWQRIDTVLGAVRAVLLVTPSASARFRTNVNVVSESMRGLTTEDYIKGTVANMAKYIEHFSFIGNGQRKIGGRDAQWLHYSQSPAGLDLENICYIIPDKGIAYIITCSTLKGELIHYRPQFERAITSFQLH